METTVLLKIASGEVNDAYYRLQQLDALSECCMCPGRYDAARICEEKSEEIWQVVSGDIGEADSVVESLIRQSEMAGMGF